MEKFQGLSESEAKLRLARDGYNELPSQKPISIFGILFSIIREPMILLLVASGLVYVLLGDPKDSIVLLISICAMIGVTFYQERKTENALKSLRDLSNPRALVIRNGERTRIQTKEVVVGDIVVLLEGDRVPADAVVIDTQNLSVDESLLTGESLAVRKVVGDEKVALAKPGGDNSSSVFSGTLISQGSGYAVVKAIGLGTAMGRIGKELQQIADQETPIKKELGRITGIFVIIGIVSCLALTIVYTLKSGDILRGILSGLTLSMTMLPEEFPVALLIYFTLGAWRISKKHVLTRNSRSIETLGAITVLCVDKTGTLTHNKMELENIVSVSGINDLSVKNAEISKDGLEVLEYAKLASKRSAFDPLEKDINSKYEKYISKTHLPLKDWHLVKEYGLAKDLFAVVRVWRYPDADDFIVSAKGSPEAIIELCKFGESERKEMMGIVHEMSIKGQRILGVAKARFRGDMFPSSPREFDHKFLGLIGFVDPIRSTVAASVEECNKAGIRTVMISGDYPGTARFIASQAGIKNPEKCILGDDLEKLSKEEIRNRIRDVNVFARIVPEQKLVIVEALKANGEIVAMTGDGVNDGPALKSAHIGIAMGERGTDVARESADLVLLDDDFSSIVAAVRMGRRIYDNLRKAVSYIFSIHIPIAGLALLPTMLDLPMILLPVHVAFLELVIDPTCATVYEMEEPDKDIMTRKPRSINARMFGFPDVLVGLLHGLTLLGVVMSVLIISDHMGSEEGVSRFMAFSTLILCNLMLILTNLSRQSVFQGARLHKNTALYWIVGIAVAALTIISFTPFLRSLFYFSKLGLRECLLVIVMSLVCYVLLELLKMVKIVYSKNKKFVV